MRKFFKYKSLKEDSFKYFVKMLVESKMYASNFKKLNDPMEGAFLADEESRNYLQLLVSDKKLS